MSASHEDPAAVRAVAVVRPSRWLRRPTRFVRHDALWPDGRVTFDVGLVDLLYRRAPADFEPVERAVRAACPEVGTGRWVDPRGAVVDGPDAPAPAPVRRHGGRPQRYRDPATEARPAPSPARRRAWRIGRGVGGLGVGVPLVLAAPDHGALGPIGVVCCLVGVASLGGLIPRRPRR